MVGLGLGVLLAVGCRREPTALELLSAAANHLSSAQSLRFSIERQGEPIVIPIPLFEVTVIEATGDYQAPGNVHAIIKTQVGDSQPEADALWRDGQSYFKLPPFLVDYIPLDLGDSFDVPAIFSTNLGIPALLLKLNNVNVGSVEEIDGENVYRITGTANGEDLTGLTGVPLAPGEAAIEAWVSKDARELVRIIITESDGNAWVIKLFDYNQPVEIPTP
jgi:hypothetical protein